MPKIFKLRKSNVIIKFDKKEYNAILIKHDNVNNCMYLSLEKEDLLGDLGLITKNGGEKKFKLNNETKINLSILLKNNDIINLYDTYLSILFSLYEPTTKNIVINFNYFTYGKSEVDSADDICFYLEFKQQTHIWNIKNRVEFKYNNRTYEISSYDDKKPKELIVKIKNNQKHSNEIVDIYTSVCILLKLLYLFYGYIPMISRSTLSNGNNIYISLNEIYNIQYKSTSAGFSFVNFWEINNLGDCIEKASNFLESNAFNILLYANSLYSKIVNVRLANIVCAIEGTYDNGVESGFISKVEKDIEIEKINTKIKVFLKDELKASSDLIQKYCDSISYVSSISNKCKVKYFINEAKKMKPIQTSDKDWAFNYLLNQRILTIIMEYRNYIIHGREIKKENKISGLECLYLADLLSICYRLNIVKLILPMGNTNVQFTDISHYKALNELKKCNTIFPNIYDITKEE